MILRLYLLTLVIYGAIDFLWVGLIAKQWFQKEIGHLMASSIKMPPAILFYLLYPLSLILFAIFPSIKTGSPLQALLYGAALGLTCYAAYDLTNLATLKSWPIKLAICDMLWGGFVSGITCFLVVAITRRFFPG